MNRFSCRTTFLLIACSLIYLAAASSILAIDTEQTAFDIPYLEGITIDGKADDWGDRGFRVDWMNVVEGKTRASPDDFDAKFRLGWNKDGLLLIFFVNDNKFTEAKNDNLWEGDSIEVFMGEKSFGNEKYQTVISPGLDPEKPELRVKKLFTEKANVEVSRTKTDTGYVCEMLFPWKNLNKPMPEGDIFFLQTYVNEKDSDAISNKYLFIPLVNNDGYLFKNYMYPIRLSKLASPPIVSSNEVRWDGKENTLKVTGITELAGKEFTVRNATRELAKGKMEKQEKQAVSFGKTVLPAPQPDEYLSDFEIEFSDGVKCKGAKSAFKPINLSADLKIPESSEGNLKIKIGLASEEKTAGYYFSSPLTVRCIAIDEEGKELPEVKGKQGEDISLKVPLSGKCALLILLCDLEDDVIAGRVLSLNNGKIVQPGFSEKPSVLAVSGIGTFSWMLVYFESFRYNEITSLRDRISSILVHNYNCITLSRARGYNMAMENSINKMAELTSRTAKSTPESLQVPAADFVITGHYKFTGGQNPIFVDRDFTCDIMLTDIKNIGYRFKKLNITSNPANYWHIAAPVIAEMNLQPRRSLGVKTNKLDETWAVLPFANDGTDVSKEIPSAIRIEMALQESGRIAKLVSHDEIDKILREMKIQSLNGATENLAGDIAKLAGADRVIMGTVSGGENQKYQLNLFIVDGKNAVILDSASAICPKNRISDSAALLALKLAERKYESPSLPVQSDEARKKEATIYEDDAAGSSIFIEDLGDRNLSVKYHNCLFSHAMSDLEAAYYLVGNDKKESYLIAKKLIFEVFACYPPDRLSAIEKKNTIRITDNILKPIPPTEDTKGALSYQAVVRDIADMEYEEAERILKEQKIKYPGLEDVFCNCRLILLYNKMGRFKEAADLIEKIPEGYKIRWLDTYADVYQKTGDEKKELEVLENIDIAGPGMLNSSYPLRYISLTAKLKGPENAIKAYGKLNAWTNIRPDIKTELAKSYLALGDKKKAGELLTLIDNDKVLEKYSGVLDTKKLRDEIKALLAQIGEVKYEWKTGAQVRKFSEKYKLYIQPVGKQEIKLLEEVAQRIGEFYGTKVEVLPEIPLPENNPYVFHRSRSQYLFDTLLKMIALSAPVPKDACFVFNITKESMYTGNLRFIYSSSRYNGALISYDFWQRYERKDLVDCIAKTAADNFQTQYGSCFDLPKDVVFRKWSSDCKNPPCIFTSSGNMDGPQHNNFSMCEDCQKQYGKIDFDKVYYVFQNTRGEREWDISSEGEREYLDKYKKDVEDALSKAAKEKDKIHK